MGFERLEALGRGHAPDLARQRGADGAEEGEGDGDSEGRGRRGTSFHWAGRVAAFICLKLLARPATYRRCFPTRQCDPLEAADGSAILVAIDEDRLELCALVDIDPYGVSVGLLLTGQACDVQRHVRRDAAELIEALRVRRRLEA